MSHFRMNHVYRTRLRIDSFLSWEIRSPFRSGWFPPPILWAWIRSPFRSGWFLSSIFRSWIGSPFRATWFPTTLLFRRSWFPLTILWQRIRSLLCTSRSTATAPLKKNTGRKNIFKIQLLLTNFEYHKISQKEHRSTSDFSVPIVTKAV